MTISIWIFAIAVMLAIGVGLVVGYVARMVREPAPNEREKRGF